MTRSKLIQLWFAAVLVAVGAVVVFHVSVTVSTGVMLLALSLVPAALVLLLWPQRQPPTASEVLYGAPRD